MSISSLLVEEKKAMLFVEEARKKAEEILKEATDMIVREVIDHKFRGG